MAAERSTAGRRQTIIHAQPSEVRHTIPVAHAAPARTTRAFAASNFIAIGHLNMREAAVAHCF
jgi:hypothetical protein